VSFALVQLGRIALLEGDQAAAEGAYREALMTAEAAGAGWFAALARVSLATALHSKGDDQAATTALQQVLTWAENANTRGRQFFYLALAGDPQTLATDALT